MIAGPNRQRELLGEILFGYASYSLLKDRGEAVKLKVDKSLPCPLSLHNTYNYTKNAFLDKICLNASILFVEGKHKNHTHYSRLVDIDDTLTEKVILICRKILPTSEDKNKELLEKTLLKLADLEPQKFEESKKFLKIYRDKMLAHGDDYTLEQAANLEKRIYYPEAEPLAKLAYGLFNIILRIEEDLDNFCIPFDKRIYNLQAHFTKGLLELSSLLKLNSQRTGTVFIF